MPTTYRLIAAAWVAILLALLVHSALSDVRHVAEYIGASVRAAHGYSSH